MPGSGITAAAEVPRLATYARICPVFSGEDATCQLEVDSTAKDEHWLSLEIPSWQTGGSFQQHDGGPQQYWNPQSTSDTASQYKGLFNGKVFTPHAQQDEVFAEFEPFLDNLVAGITGCIFAYGQTGIWWDQLGTGKTYTVYGGAKYRERGLIPRLVCGLFQRLRRKRKEAGSSSYSFSVSVKCLEVYNDQGYDLLAERSDGGGGATATTATSTTTALKMDLFQSTPNLAERECATEREALDCVFLAALNRSDAKTKTNTNSSRSHAIFTLIVTQCCPQEGTRTLSRLHLVDLAGSERVHKSGSAGGGSTLTDEKQHEAGRLTEAKSINKSLHFLEQVVLGMQKGESFLPFRNSLMTFLLREALVGNCKTALIATISALVRNAAESLSTIRFAQRCSKVVLHTHIVPNVNVDYRFRAERLQAENKKLMDRIGELTKKLATGAEAAHEKPEAGAELLGEEKLEAGAVAEQGAQEEVVADKKHAASTSFGSCTNVGGNNEATALCSARSKTLSIDVPTSSVLRPATLIATTTSSAAVTPRALGSGHVTPSGRHRHQASTPGGAAAAAGSSSSTFFRPLPLSLRHLGFAEMGRPTDAMLDEEFGTVTALVTKLMEVAYKDVAPAAGGEEQHAGVVGATAPAASTDAPPVAPQTAAGARSDRVDVVVVSEDLHDENTNTNTTTKDHGVTPTSGGAGSSSTPTSFGKKEKRYVRVSPGRAAAAWIENVMRASTETSTGGAIITDQHKEELLISSRAVRPSDSEAQNNKSSTKGGGAAGSSTSSRSGGVGVGGITISGGINTKPPAPRRLSGSAGGGDEGAYPGTGSSCSARGGGSSSGDRPSGERRNRRGSSQEVVRIDLTSTGGRAADEDVELEATGFCLEKERRLLDQLQKNWYTARRTKNTDADHHRGAEGGRRT